LSDQEHNNEPTPLHFEGGGIVIDKPKSEEEITRKAREDEDHEFKRDQVKTNRRLTRLNFFLVIGTFCGLGIGVWQSKVSQQSADTSEKSVLLAQKTERDSRKSGEDQIRQSATALDATKNQFIQDQRPYLWYDDDEMVRTKSQPWIDGSSNGDFNAGKLSWSIWIRNFGKSPAIRTHSFGYISVTQPNPEDPESWAKGKLSEKGAGGIYPPGSGFFVTARTKDRVPAPIAAFFHNQPVEVMAAHIEVVYYDLSGNRYTSTICLAMQGNGVSKTCNKEGKVQ
jgi:hypothetical protein